MEGGDALLVDQAGLLTGLITIKDIDMMKRFPNASKDRQGRLRAGLAAIHAVAGPPARALKDGAR